MAAHPVQHRDVRTGNAVDCAPGCLTVSGRGRAGRNGPMNDHARQLGDRSTVHDVPDGLRVRPDDRLRGDDDRRGGCAWQADGCQMGLIRPEQA